MTSRRRIPTADERESREGQFLPGHVGGRIASAQPVRRRSGTLRRPALGTADQPSAPSTPLTWDDFPPGFTWDDIPAGLTWENMRTLDDLQGPPSPSTPLTWDDFPPGFTWDDIPAGVTWDDLTRGMLP